MTGVKICGLSTGETMQAALDAGADFVGLMFFTKSPRNLTLHQAAILAEQARGVARVVAVTVDADDAELRAIAETVRPDLIQAHGNETPSRIAEMEALAGIGVYKVLKVRNAADVAGARAFSRSRFMMYDALAPAGSMLPGGNGLAFDWTILKDAVKPFMLAGGLNARNVSDAIRVSGAQMVDVSSGVESSPGVKDIALIRKFIEAARAAS